MARVRFADVTKRYGRPIDVEHIHIWRVADGKLPEHWMVRDDLAAMRPMAAPTA